jgi:hypothetical protein
MRDVGNELSECTPSPTAMNMAAGCALASVKT